MKDRAELMAHYAEVISHEGEGLMLDRADAPDHCGLERITVKLKPALDAEVVWSAMRQAKGGWPDNLAAPTVQTTDGKRFRIGSGFSAVERRDRPPIGATVTYRYQQLSKAGIPRFPRYWRLREAF